MKKHHILILSLWMAAALVAFSACSKCAKSTEGCAGENKSQTKGAPTYDTVASVNHLSRDTFYMKFGEKHYKMAKIPIDSVSWDDDNENPVTLAARPAAAHSQKCTSDNFAGSHRMDPKTSIFRGNTTSYNTVDELVAHLPSDAEMKNHTPKITEAPTSERVEEEQKYVKVKTAYIYGIYREDDNDFHCIIGNGEVGGSKMKLFNIEFSALPPKNSKDFADMKDIRSQIIDRFGDITCGSGVYKPVETLIPVTVEGSLFFDVDHPAGKVGFSAGGISFHPETAWEIHPVVKLKFD